MKKTSLMQEVILFLLPDVDTSYVTIDGFVRGTGSGSCGPIPSKERMIDFGYLKPFNFSFEIEVVENK